MEFDKGVTYVETPYEDGDAPSIGWSYDGILFTAPALAKEEKEAYEQMAIVSNIALNTH